MNVNVIFQREKSLRVSHLLQCDLKFLQNAFEYHWSIDVSLTSKTVVKFSRTPQIKPFRLGPYLPTANEFYFIDLVTWLIRESKAILIANRICMWRDLTLLLYSSSIFPFERTGNKQLESWLFPHCKSVVLTLNYTQQNSSEMSCVWPYCI